MTDTASLEWLDGPPDTPTGVTWGVPWERGTLAREDALELTDSTGASVPVQTWPTAYWPDGSVKWTGHAAVLSPGGPADLKLAVADGDDRLDAAGASITTGDPADTVSIDEGTDELVVDTGAIVCRIGRSGSAVVREIEAADGTVCTDGRLVALRESRGGDEDRLTRTRERFESRIEGATVEREGALRTVVKVEGVHAAVEGLDTDREWLPFTLRLEFYAGLDAVEMTHTFVYDGDQDSEFVAGLGVSFAVPMSGPDYDRHVRLGGDDGLFREPARPLPPGAGDEALHERQVAGDPLDGSGIDADTESGGSTADGDDWRAAIRDVTPWNRFRLVQDSPDHYAISKTAGDGYCWVDATHGDRASGLGFVGSAAGGLAVGLRDFWETYPSSLEVANLLGEEARLRAWFWSPEAEAMDFRWYDDPDRNEGGLSAAYGGVDAELSTADGIANTSELTLSCFDGVPDGGTLRSRGAESRDPSILVCDPERYHDVGVFGRWSLEDRSTPRRAWIEDQLDAAVEFYRDEVERRHWYGFWDYGDVMHTYDPARHEWYYDVGGYAWQNTEQMPTMWFWYVFLRSGRADLFRLAAAQTRHTSEVDVYHGGPLAGLGSRHNVRHWGGGCKEARIGMAGHHRFYYYLTGGDERIGEVMRSVRDADHATVDVDPMRDFVDDDEHPTHARVAPEWLTFSSNWLTEWERFEDEAYRERIETGIDCLKGMPHRMFSGSNFGYDPETAELHHIGDGNYGHTFLHCMGGPQVWPELADLIDDPEFEEMLAETGELYLDREERYERLPESVADSMDKLPMYATAMAGFAAERSGDDDLAEDVWDLLLYDEARRIDLPIETEPVDEGPRGDVEEIPSAKTNIMSIWSLNVIACLDYVGEHLPEPPAE